MQENINLKSKTKDRLLKFIELNSISLHQFHKKIGVSNGYLAKVESIGSPVIEKIAEIYPDLSLDWLFTGRGHMLRSQQKPTETTVQTNAQEVIELQRKLITQLERNRPLESLITPHQVEESLAYLSDYILRLKQAHEKQQHSKDNN